MLLFLSNHLHSVCNLPEHATPAYVSLLSLTQLTVCVYVEGYACWWWPRPPQSLPPFRPSPSQGEGSRMGSNRQIYPSCSMEACPGPLVSITRRHGHATACGACSPAHTHTRTRILSASMQHINKHNYTIKAWNSCIRTSIQLGTQIWMSMKAPRNPHTGKHTWQWSRRPAACHRGPHFKQTFSEGMTFWESVGCVHVCVCECERLMKKFRAEPATNSMHITICQKDAS